jgi:hypothetical protein
MLRDEVTVLAMLLLAPVVHAAAQPQPSTGAPQPPVVVKEQAIDPQSPLALDIRRTNALRIVDDDKTHDLIWKDAAKKEIEFRYSLDMATWRVARDQADAKVSEMLLAGDIKGAIAYVRTNPIIKQSGDAQFALFKRIQDLTGELPAFAVGTGYEKARNDILSDPNAADHIQSALELYKRAERGDITGAGIDQLIKMLTAINMDGHRQ